jgi:type I restriction enzyme S subunit
MANKNIPQIRFKGFEGEWEEKIFEDICTFGNGYTPSKAIDAYWEKGTLPWFRLEDIRENGRILKDSIQHITPQAVKGKLFPANSIIMSTTATIGEHALLIADSLANQQFTFFIKNVNRYNYNDLFFFYKCFSIGDWCKKNSNAGGLLAVNMPELKKLIISFPNSFSEQTRIASLFTAIDKQISCSEAKLDKLRTVKKTLLKKMFASQGEKTPQIRFKGFEEEWEEKLLGEIGTINSGCDYKHLNRGNIPVYGTGGYMTSVDKALSYTKDAIGIGRKGTIDNPYILKAPFWTVDTLFYVFPKDNINLNFLFNLYCKVDWRSKNEASGVPSLSKGIINNVCIKTASLSEQTRIASLFTALDKQISCQEKKIEKLKAVKKTLLKKMFV